MDIAFDDGATSLVVILSDVEYGILKQSDPVELERLFLSHMQLIQDRNKQLEADQLRTFLEQATPDQKAEVLQSISNVEIARPLRIAP